MQSKFVDTEKDLEENYTVTPPAVANVVDGLTDDGYSHVRQPFAANTEQHGPAIHKTLLGHYGNYTAYLVNGDKVRNTSKELEGFTDWAIHGTGPSQLPEVPKNEAWIEDSLDPKEQHIALSCALRYLETGSYNKALALAKREREHAIKSPAGTGSRDRQNFSKQMLLEGPLLLPVGVAVWLVDGDLVRRLDKTDFVLGGNGEAYKWIPENEIWIEQDVEPDERIYILVHELVEWYLMRTRNYKYDKAHNVAEQVEYRWRHTGRPSVEAMNADWVEKQVKETK